MNHWIFTITSHKSDGKIFSPEEILSQRAKDQFWGLGEKTPNRKNLEMGDQVVFYVGNPVKGFGASAHLASRAFELSKQEQDKFSHGTTFYRAQYGVNLEQISLWDKARSVDQLLGRLDFIENKEFWRSYFQGGVRQIDEKDFRTILEGNAGAIQSRMLTAADLESESEFALETHLEEFLDQNWDNIDFGTTLKKYAVEEQSGRQFPAGPWSIDFLCIDKATSDFVVLELKRGKTSDSAVGQILRYMTYVKKNLAKPGQSVRGIIIAKEIADALRYAIESVPNVSVLTYRVDFKLIRSGI